MTPIDASIAYTVLAWIVGAVISLAAFIGGWKVVKRDCIAPLVVHVRNVQSVSGLAPTLAAMMPKLDMVCKMVMPNGGSMGAAVACFCLNTQTALTHSFPSP